MSGKNDRGSIFISSCAKNVSFVFVVSAEATGAGASGMIVSEAAAPGSCDASGEVSVAACGTDRSGDSRGSDGVISTSGGASKISGVAVVAATATGSLGAAGALGSASEGACPAERSDPLSNSSGSAEITSVASIVGAGVTGFGAGVGVSAAASSTSGAGVSSFGAGASTGVGAAVGEYWAG